MLFGFPNFLPYICTRKLKKMAKDVNIVVLCNEIYNGLKAKGCGMTPIADSEGSFNGEFVNIVFDALTAAKK